MQIRSLQTEIRKDKKPKIRKLSKKLLLVPATEAVDELPPVTIETKVKKPKKQKDEKPKKQVKQVKLVIESESDEE